MGFEARCMVGPHGYIPASLGPGRMVMTHAFTIRQQRASHVVDQSLATPQTSSCASRAGHTMTHESARRMLVIFPTAKPKSQTHVHELHLGESVRIGDYVITILDSDNVEVRMLVESIGGSELIDDEPSWDDSWQSRLGD